MRIPTILAAIAIALPATAMAQVGPNPSVSGGSQDPTVGNSTDAATAPDDAPSPATADVRTRTDTETPAGSAATGTDAASGPADTTTTETGTSATTPGATTTTTETGTKAMRPPRRR